MLRDFVSLFGVAYLVDNVFLWAVAVAFSLWFFHGFNGVTAMEWGSFTVQAAAAVLGAIIMRLLHGRSIIGPGAWVVSPHDDSFPMWQAFVAFLVSFIATLGYGDVVEMTGSPASSERFLVGRVRSIAIVSVVLIAANLVLSIFQRIMPSYGKDGTTQFSPSWYQVLNWIIGVTIAIDLVVEQSWALTWPVFALLGGAVLINAVFNAISGGGDLGGVSAKALSASTPSSAATAQE